MTVADDALHWAFEITNQCKYDWNAFSGVKSFDSLKPDEENQSQKHICL